MADKGEAAARHTHAMTKIPDMIMPMSFEENMNNHSVEELASCLR